MRISFERTGGFGNITLRAEIDSAQLPSERARELENLVERVTPLDQHTSSQATKVADDFQYHVVVENGGKKQTVDISDAAASDDLKLLFDFLGDEALRQLKARRA